MLLSSPFFIASFDVCSVQVGRGDSASFKGLRYFNARWKDVSRVSSSSFLHIIHIHAVIYVYIYIRLFLL